MSINNQTLVNLRREFHAWPEPGWAEFVTTAKLIERLEQLGYTVYTGTQVIKPEFVRGRSQATVDKGLAAARAQGISEDLLARIGDYTGCMALVDTGRPGPVMAMRFDIDSVPVTEATCDCEARKINHRPAAEGFASTNHGYMHACGHDGHMAIGLGVAQWIMDNLGSLKGKVKLLFQPAEEGVRGARPMAESGILDDVDYFACAHLGCDAPTGTIVAAPADYLCTLKMDLRFIGKPAHAGMNPHLGKNALAAACNAAIQLMGISTHGEGMTRVNVGVLKAGEGRNVIPSSAEMQIEVRGATEKINNYMVEEATRRAKGVALGFDVEMELSVVGEAVDFIPDDEMTDLVMAVANSIPAIKNTQRSYNFNGSDDATVLIKRVQAHGGKAAYFVIGSDLKGGHHQAEFDIDEEQLYVGYQMFVGIVNKILGNS
ncbi:MAG: amidohydrolase [Deferribacteraceae bacterium]|jgi:aminobenzoyl-glutamate utilization protein A|nr:amidohydrolase [Deferribacteraceae bacterium]